MSPFNPEDPIHAAALRLVKAERARSYLSRREDSLATADELMAVLRAKARASEELLAAVTEALTAAGARGELGEIELPR